MIKDREKNSHTIAAFCKGCGGADISAVADWYQSQGEYFAAAWVLEWPNFGLPSKSASGLLWPVCIVTLLLSSVVDDGLLGVFRRLLLILWS